jgi:adenylate cyclase class 2
VSVTTESELKIPVQDLGAVRNRLRASDAQLVHPAQREVNMLFDTHDRRLTSGGQVLRLRAVGDRHLVTFKGAASFRGAIKERDEIEMEVSDGESAATILGRLGYRVTMRYEKDRETWLVDEVAIALDHTPMGDYVEIEGVVRELYGVARMLELDPLTAVPGSYVDLWQQHRSTRPELGLPSDMVFPE